MSYGIENELCGLSHNLNYMNTHTHIRTKKGTMGQFGPMVLKYNKIIKKGGYKFFILYFCIF